jgi:hypothetical protein
VYVRALDVGRPCGERCILQRAVGFRVDVKVTHAQVPDLLDP